MIFNLNVIRYTCMVLSYKLYVFRYRCIINSKLLRDMFYVERVTYTSLPYFNIGSQALQVSNERDYFPIIFYFNIIL